MIPSGNLTFLAPFSHSSRKAGMDVFQSQVSFFRLNFNICRFLRITFMRELRILGIFSLPVNDLFFLSADGYTDLPGCTATTHIARATPPEIIAQRRYRQCHAP